MAELHRNAFKHAIAIGKTQIGLWSTLCSPIAVEIIADSGFDWMLLDMEHAPADLPEILAQLRAAGSGPTTPIVRVPWNDPVMFKRILDGGAQSLLVPYIQNEDEARRAVSATRYPPLGIRGVTVCGRSSRYGRVKNYLKMAESEICLLLQLETRDALMQLEAIAQVQGVDGVFIGPSDLAASFGHIGNPQHEDVQAAIQNAARRLKACGKPAGILTANEDDAKRYIEWGFTFVAVGIDVLLLRNGADALAKTFKPQPSTGF